MVFQLVQSRVKHLHLSIERVKLLLIPVDLTCILIIENTNFLTEHSDSLLDFSEISSNCFRTTLFTAVDLEKTRGHDDETGHRENG